MGKTRILFFPQHAILALQVIEKKKGKARKMTEKKIILGKKKLEYWFDTFNFASNKRAK